MEGGGDETIEGSKIILMSGGQRISWVFVTTHNRWANGEMKFFFTDNV